MQHLPRQSGPVYLGADGRLTDGEGRGVFTDKIFADPMDADMWLMLDDDGRFFMAYLSFDWRRYVGKLITPNYSLMPWPMSSRACGIFAARQRTATRSAVARVSSGASCGEILGSSTSKSSLTVASSGFQPKAAGIPHRAQSVFVACQ